jgi:PIN domain nuclease of toxin-antitoxin system
LVHAGRVSFNRSPANVLGALLHYVSILPITLEIALTAPALALPHGDQFDRIITATAKVYRLPLITKDANITGSGLASIHW